MSRRRPIQREARTGVLAFGLLCMLFITAPGDVSTYDPFGDYYDPFADFYSPYGSYYDPFGTPCSTYGGGGLYGNNCYGAPGPSYGNGTMEEHVLEEYVITVKLCDGWDSKYIRGCPGYNPCLDPYSGLMGSSMCYNLQVTTADVGLPQAIQAPSTLVQPPQVEPPDC